MVNCGQDFTVIVDYSHTGDALENILKSINELKKGKVIQFLDVVETEIQAKDLLWEK